MQGSSNPNAHIFPPDNFVYIGRFYALSESKTNSPIRSAKRITRFLSDRGTRVTS